MTFSSLLRAFAALAAWLVLVPAPGWTAPLLAVDQLAGRVEIEHQGQERALAPGDSVAQGDVLRVNPGAHLSLRIASHGFLDLGPGAELLVERLPHASFAPDLRSEFVLTRGYLRIVWKHPQLSTTWPLYVLIGDQRLALTSGEYFFQSGRKGREACVASGQLAVSGETVEAVTTLRPSACYDINTADSAGRVMDMSDWVAIRASFSLDGRATVAARTAVANAPQPQPAPPAAAPAVQPPPPRVPDPVVEPSPSLTSEAASEPRGKWTLNIVSLPERGAAEQETARIAAAGFRPVVQEAQVKGQTWYRVQIPGFETVAQARAVADQLKPLGYRSAWVIPR